MNLMTRGVTAKLCLALLAGLLITGGTMLYGRVPFQVTVNRAPGSLYTVDSDGSTRNTFLLKIVNKDPDPAPVRYEIGLFKEGREEAAAVGSFVHVFVDRHTGRPHPIPHSFW